MVVGITSTSTKSSSSSTEAAEAYKKKQQQKLITPATVASLITCCAGQEVMGGFPNDIKMNDDNDNDSFINPSMQASDSFAASSHSSAKKQKPPMILKTPIKNDSSFGSAVKKQQQRNRFTSSPLIERDSSLVKSQSGLLSLLSSGTFAETSTSPLLGASNNYTNGTTAHNMNNNTMTMNPISMKRNQTPPHPSMVTSHHTPPRSAGRRKQQQQQYSPTRQTSNQQPSASTTSASPAMELSMARQSANATLADAQYQRSRSGGWTIIFDNQPSKSSDVQLEWDKVSDVIASMDTCFLLYLDFSPFPS